VEEVAVAAGPENLRGRALVAFCVPSAGMQLTGIGLRAQYAAAAPAYSVPDIVHVVDSLPKLPSGKIDRMCLAKFANEERLV
jgi:acyl-coenzyme A synthetase/AMP-(fatty) acid ligase